MSVWTDADVKALKLVVLATCQTLLDKLAPDDPDQLDLIDHLAEVCIAIERDLERNSR